MEKRQCTHATSIPARTIVSSDTSNNNEHSIASLTPLPFQECPPKDGLTPEFYSKAHNDVRIQNLQSYLRFYTDQIVLLEEHVRTLYDDWIIDSDTRLKIMGKLNRMVPEAVKEYNQSLDEHHKDLHEEFLDEYLSTSPGCVVDEKLYENLISTYIETRDQVSVFDFKNKSPLSKIKQKLLEIMCDTGSKTINQYLEIYFDRHHASIIPKETKDIFDLYNKLFVPISIEILPLKPENQVEIKTPDNEVIQKDSPLKYDPYQKIFQKDTICLFDVFNYESDIDSLVDNSCYLTFVLPSVKKLVVFDGYVRAESLGCYARTAGVCSEYLLCVKRETTALIDRHELNTNGNFFYKYFKMINGNNYFCQSAHVLAERAIADYQYNLELSRKNFMVIMKEFAQLSVHNMFRCIKLLLMGDEKNVGTASLLFNALPEKEDNGEILEKIVYHNLSYRLQSKLKKANTRIKASTAHLKTLTIESIPLEKRLVAAVNMPDSVKAYILEKNAENDSENNYKVQTAINGLMQFPWKQKDAENQYSEIHKSVTKSRAYLQKVAQRLNDAVYGHENSKKVLIELVGKWIQNPSSAGQVIGLVGPPGIGKTLLARSISKALDLPLSIVGLGGMSDSSDLIGHSFTYAGAQYGMIVRQMIRAGNWRSVMFFDEVDKVSKRNDTNEIYNTLIHITDPNMNQNFQDRFYSSSIDFDLSGVLIVFSYNDSSKLDAILRDRINEIKITAYSITEKITIAQKYILKELCENLNFDRNRIIFDDQVIRYIIDFYTFEAGVRELRRMLEKILLKLNIDRFYLRGPFARIIYDRTRSASSTKKIDDNENTIYDMPEEKSHAEEDVVSSYVNHTPSALEQLLPEKELDQIFNLECTDVQIDISLVHRYLEKPVTQVEEIQKKDLVGVINGLYATSVGLGGIIPIQIFPNYMAEGQGAPYLRLTGNQERVMQESVSCAYTTAISLLSHTNREKVRKLYPHGFHIHAPDGATPKDGPSAGCAFATAFFSVLVNKPINREIAMTGEIELTGKISKIGGLDAKLAGAKKAGVKIVYLSEENREDYVKLVRKSPELFHNTETGQEGLTIHIVKHISEIVGNPQVILGVLPTDLS
jgi:endopeptidase La